MIHDYVCVDCGEIEQFEIHSPVKDDFPHICWKCRGERGRKRAEEEERLYAGGICGMLMCGDEVLLRTDAEQTMQFLELLEKSKGS